MTMRRPSQGLSSRRQRQPLRVVLSLALSPSEAADVLQEASLRAWRHRDQRRGEFRPWFLSIAYREARRPVAGG